MKKFRIYIYLVAVMLFLSFGQRVFAQDFLYKSLSFPDDNKENNLSGSYLNPWIASIGDFQWNLVGFYHNRWLHGWTFIRCKKKVSETPRIVNKSMFDKNITKVELVIDSINNNSANLKAITLVVATDSTLKKDVRKISIDSLKKGTRLFNIPSNINTQDKYLGLVFDFYNVSESFVQVSKVNYYSRDLFETSLSFKELLAQLQISVAYFFSLGLYFLV